MHSTARPHTNKWGSSERCLSSAANTLTAHLLFVGAQSLPPYELPCVLSTCRKRRVIQLSATGRSRCAHCHSPSETKAIQYSSIQLQIQPKRGIWLTILPHANTNLPQKPKKHKPTLLSDEKLNATGRSLVLPRPTIAPCRLCLPISLSCIS